jgi:hypothetical protein
VNVSNVVTRREAERYVNDSMSNLYMMLAPATDASGGTTENPLEAGRDAFEAKLREVKPVVCNAYLSHPGAESAIDLTVLIASVLLTIPMGGIPVLPMAAIIVKIGLREICPKP